MSWLDAFHFLRPAWLLAVPVIALTWFVVRRRETPRQATGGIVAEHLENALTVNRQARVRLLPVDGIAAACLALAVAAAGPTWSRQPSPWFAETAPLVLAIEVSDSMRASDFQPTRLDRARFKVLDLIAARTGSRTAVIAYDGSAHIVLPPSSDIDVLKPLLESLDPAIMPVKGTRVAPVLPLARSLLGEDARIGTVLFVNDGFAPTDIAVLAEFGGQADAPALAALVVGTDEGGVPLLPDGSMAVSETGQRIDTTIDRSLLSRAEREASLRVIRAEAGDGDIDATLRVLSSNLHAADDPDARWKDAGWWFLWPAALLLLAWFRRGWSMQW